jgi:gamma-butyrobetaine dioxygenase
MNTEPRYQIDSLETGDSRITVHWHDGHVSHFPGIWLLESCQCETCGRSEVAVRHTRLLDKPNRPQPMACDYDDETLRVDWGGRHHSRYDLVWLRSQCLSESARRERKFRATPWGREILQRLPIFSYPALTASPDLHLQFLESILDPGFAVLRDVPPERERTQEIAALVGKLRMTNYEIYELQTKPDPEISGDMAIPLKLHTDEPYRVEPPAITFFHVIRQAEHGGVSTLADSLRLAESLRDRDPQAFAILATIPARYHRSLIEGRLFEYQRTIIQRDADGDVNGVFLLERGMAPVDCALDRVEAFYDALRRFLQLIDSREDEIEIRLETGEMLVFNNHRLMHGRTAFDPSSGRHVRSCHVDLDEFHSRLRIAYRDNGDPRRWMTFIRQ